MFETVAGHYREAFRGHSPVMWGLCLASLVNRAGTMVIPFLTLYLTEELRLSEAEVSTVLLTFGVGSVAGSLSGGWLVGVLGTRSTMIGSLLGVGVVFLLLSRAETFVSVCVGVFAVGAIGDTFRPAAMTAVVEVARGHRLLQSQTLLRLMVNLGWAMGPALGGFLALVDYDLLFIGDAVTGWLAIPVVAWSLRGPRHGRPASLPEPSRRTPTQASSRPPWRDGPFVALVGLSFAVACCMFVGVFLLPLFLHEVYGLNEARVGLLMAIQPVAIVLFEMALVQAASHNNPMRVYGIGALLICLGLGMLDFGHGFWFGALAMVVWSFGEMTTMPFSSTMVGSRVAPERSGPYFGWYNGSFSVALLVAGPLGLAIESRWGWSALWWGLMVVGVLLFAAAWAIAPRFGAPPREASANDEVGSDSSDG